MNYKIIPQPVKCTALEGAGVDYTSGLGFSVDGVDSSLLQDLRRFLALSHIPAGPENIQIRAGKESADESYTLEIRDHQVQIDSPVRAVPFTPYRHSSS